MSDTEGSQCIGCRLAREENEALLAELKKAKSWINHLAQDQFLVLPKHGEHKTIFTKISEAFKRYRGETK